MRFFTGFFCVLAICCGARADSGQRPNFLVIVADDLGYSDLGAFGGEIDTPNLDRLAEAGLRLTNFHTAATCSPTRAMLMTGVDHHRAGIGTMSELITRGQRGHPGYEGYLNQRVVTIAELLRDAGYDTLMSGKWHLGTKPEQDPSRRGFRRAFAMEGGGHDHFGRVSVIQGLPPLLDRAVRGTFRWLDDVLDPFGWSSQLIKAMGGVIYREDGRDVKQLPADFYSSDFFTDKMIGYLDDHARSESGKPFFAYLAFTAPHFPLQAPPASIAKYHGRYAAGWSALREARIRRQEELGLLQPRPGIGTASTLADWNALTPAQQQRAQRNMEIYAGMVDRLDWDVGRLLQHMRQRGLLEHTVIIFLSDNGAEGGDARLTVKQVAGITLPEEALDKMGTRGTFDSYGPNWAQAATAPHRLYKATSAEGGIVAPAFITGYGALQPGAVSAALVTVRDVVPTLLDLADVPRPGATYRGAAVIPPDGRSLRPLLDGSAAGVHPQDEPLGWEIFGQRALRKGDWKITWITPPRGPGVWQLYDVAEDPGEQRDRAADEPARLGELKRDWDDYVRRNGVILETRVVGQ